MYTKQKLTDPDRIKSSIYENLRILRSPEPKIPSSEAGSTNSPQNLSPPDLSQISIPFQKLSLHLQSQTHFYKSSAKTDLTTPNEGLKTPALQCRGLWARKRDEFKDGRGFQIQTGRKTSWRRQCGIAGEEVMRGAWVRSECERGWRKNLHQPT